MGSNTAGLETCCLAKGDSVESKHHKCEATIFATAETDSCHGEARANKIKSAWPFRTASGTKPE